MTLEPVTVQVRVLARELNISPEAAAAAVALFDDGHPIPFIARYRQDATHNLDEEQLRQLSRALLAARTLAERKMTILRSLELVGKLDEELERKIRETRSPKRLEDIYLPFKPKRQTLASAARQRGLEPLAREILDATVSEENLNARAAEFINEDRGVKSIADALLGAGQIISEWFSEKVETRQRLRDLMQRGGKISSKRAPSFVIEDAATEISATQNKVVTSPTAEISEPIIESVSEPIVEPVAEEVAESKVEIVASVESVAEIATEIVAPAENATPSTPENSNAVAEIGEQFQQWRESQKEKPLPVVKSQNKVRKEQKQTLKKRKAEAVLRKMRRQEKVFHDYFAFSSLVRKVPPYRVLAMNRGEKEGVLKVGIEVNLAESVAIVEPLCVPAEHAHKQFLSGCVRDAVQRLLLPALENETRKSLTEHAEQHSLGVFAKNLRSLLLQPPLERRRVLALDPGFKNGIKAAALDEFGNVLGHETLFIADTPQRKSVATASLLKLMQTYKSTVIAIGNGTGCREAEAWVARVISEHLAGGNTAYIVVSEAGASVYSASNVAKEEFPNLDILVRGAISIGRRLQDPLNELVKIDPQSLGVGMYQHDVKPKSLKEQLAEVVESCVNFVGVDINSASVEILRYVAGLNQLTARRIYDYRQQHGPFKIREDLKKVPGLGPVTFAYSAGFLRIPRGTNPLDATWIHPESYELATQILTKLGFSLEDLRLGETQAKLADRVGKIDLTAFVNEFIAAPEKAAATEKEVPKEESPAEEKISVEVKKDASLKDTLLIGEHTIRGILSQFARPGRDPRQELPPPIFKCGILELDDLSVGMELQGTVLNVVDFGAFVDIGLHDSGLVHISQMAERFVASAHDLVAVGDVVRVWVQSVDKDRKRVSLSMHPPGTPPRPAREKLEKRENAPRREPRPRQSAPRDNAPRPQRPHNQGEQRPPSERQLRGENTRGENQRGENSQRENNRGEKSDSPQQRFPRERRDDVNRAGNRAENRDAGKRPEGNRDGGRRDGRRDNYRDSRERVAKTYIVESSQKEVKPLSEEMRKGKEAMRSFSDLAQLFGRAQTNEKPEKK